MTAEQMVADFDKNFQCFSESAIKRFWSKVKISKEDDCWEWNGNKRRNGYGRFNPTHITSISTHRFSFIISGGIFDKGNMVLHSCNNRICVNPKHLRSGTHQENMDDLTNSGMRARGEKSRPKHLKNGLDENKVKEIKKLINMKSFNQKEIAKMFNVSESIITRIKQCVIWSHV